MRRPPSTTLATEPTQSRVIVREAQPADAEAVRVIRNAEIEHGTAIWTTTPLDAEAGKKWLIDHLHDGVALVAEDEDGRIIGFATLGPWHPYAGYAGSGEDSVYVAPTAQGRGVGRALLTALIEAGAQRGYHVLVAMIESGNQASLALHEQLGFVRAGQLDEVGRKFDRWLDLTILLLRL